MVQHCHIITRFIQAKNQLLNHHRGSFSWLIVLIVHTVLAFRAASPRV